MQSGVVRQTPRAGVSLGSILGPCLFTETPRGRRRLPAGSRAVTRLGLFSAETQHSEGQQTKCVNT